MKSTRINLEDVESIKSSNAMLKRLKDKHFNIDIKKIAKEEECLINMNNYQLNFIESHEHEYFTDENNNPNLKTPLNEEKNLKSIFGSISTPKETKDETDNKEFNPLSSVKKQRKNNLLLKNQFLNSSDKTNLIRSNTNFLNMINIRTNKFSEYFTEEKEKTKEVDNENNSFCKLLKEDLEFNSKLTESQKLLAQNSFLLNETKCPFGDNLSEKLSDDDLYSSSSYDSISVLNYENSSVIESQMNFYPFPSPCHNEIFNLKKDHRSFGLKHNNDDIISPSNQTHRLLPLHYKNDESYKLKLFKFLRKPAFNNSKTETCKYLQQRKSSQGYDGNLTKFFKTFGIKRRKVSSERKVFDTDFALEDNRALENSSLNLFKEKLPPQYFKIYADKDIGFSEVWQKQLKKSEIDDDVETDSEQLNAAGKHVLRELMEGIKYFMKNKNNVRNFAFQKEIRNQFLI